MVASDPSVSYTHGFMPQKKNPARSSLSSRTPARDLELDIHIRFLVEPQHDGALGVAGKAGHLYSQLVRAYRQGQEPEASLETGLILDGGVRLQRANLNPGIGHRGAGRGVNDSQNHAGCDLAPGGQRQE